MKEAVSFVRCHRACLDFSPLFFPHQFIQGHFHHVGDEMHHGMMGAKNEQPGLQSKQNPLVGINKTQQSKAGSSNRSIFDTNHSKTKRHANP